MNKYKILVLCTGNSCRSQMAQGFLNYYGNDKIRAVSAGIEAHGVNPIAIQVMSEAGIDISHHTSNLIGEFDEQHFNMALTVCDHAKENCPYFQNSDTSVHYNFNDPAKTQGTEEEIIESFRRVRDEIDQYSKNIIETIKLNNQEEE